MSESTPERYTPLKIYAEKHARHGANYAGLGWASHARQLTRFETLLRGVLNECETVLDVGCGYGDLVPWVMHKDYTGIDIHEAAIEVAQSTFSSPDFKFRVEDIRDTDPDEKYDLIVGSGVLSHYGAQDTMDILKSMWQVTNKIMGVNGQYSHYGDLLGVMSMLRDLRIDKYEIRHAYLDDDLTIIAWKSWE